MESVERNLKVHSSKSFAKSHSVISISFILGQKDVPRDFLVGSSREMEGYALQVVAQLGGGAQTFARKRSFVAPERIRGTTFRRIFMQHMYIK